MGNWSVLSSNHAKSVHFQIGEVHSGGKGYFIKSFYLKIIAFCLIIKSFRLGIIARCHFIIAFRSKIIASRLSIKSFCIEIIASCHFIIAFYLKIIARRLTTKLFCLGIIGSCHFIKAFYSKIIAFCLVIKSGRPPSIGCGIMHMTDNWVLQADMFGRSRCEYQVKPGVSAQQTGTKIEKSAYYPSSA